jgi:hypothetical protein
MERQKRRGWWEEHSDKSNTRLSITNHASEEESTGKYFRPERQNPPS